MTMNSRHSLTLIFFCILLSGCSGYDRVLFATTTNVGLDIDTTPPTAEISIARREIAIEPVFPNMSTNKIIKTEDMQNQKQHDATQVTTLPLLASFGFQGSFFNPTITAHFAGGDAAINLAKETIDNSDEKIDSSICLNGKPQDMRSPIKKLWHWITGKSDAEALKEANSEPRPFYFATDTTFGVKVAWSGTGGAYPDTLKLGYNRKEFASPPVVIRRGCNGNDDLGIYQVTIPSFLATINNASNFNVFSKSELGHVQFFATGKAATEFAKRASVRQVTFEQMAPTAAAKAAEIETKQLKQKTNQ